MKQQMNSLCCVQNALIQTPEFLGYILSCSVLLSTGTGDVSIVLHGQLTLQIVPFIAL